MSAAAGTTQGATLRARKEEHQRLAATDAVQTRTPPGWGDIHLVHEALPEVDLDAVSLETELLGRTLRAPLVIAGMTGGHDGATAVNAALARAAERHGLAIGLGSQRAALVDPTLEPTYAVVREHAPSAFVIGNVGAAQLVEQGGKGPLTLAQLRRTVEMIDADALAIHLNVLEESVQPEGDRRARGVADAIAELVGTLGVPVIVKETGAGIARTTAERLAALGVGALDVGGLGGTSFALVERLRAQLQHDQRGIELGEDLAEWGIPTAVSLAGARTAGLPLIATGGIRSGLDAAKALALGATAVGVARPLLLAALDGDAALDAWIGRFLETLRTVLQLTGCTTAAQLRERPLVVGGETRAWIDDLGYGPLRPAPAASEPGR
ncbi:type 2 isopentenyl-diphosphate Delta-isomerase [Conexibacter arvalis]|uniref:Isopentenyl-diphosphate delta-isomerase n=1 Tax=Conexibacter arvalis TaxID=912552 RepID=A0A840IBY0_9ACTN|nr:type 2 isopentenyl-diphosphate Delta-isomerase [Conexibacter arvalis]MBB4661835.1 isopentenyl-diphosphate delta-isomerase [Conexibacter arvalis]